jgi:hypothetical protein
MKAAEWTDASHGENLGRVFDAYLQHRRMCYGDETRWPESPFWSARQ